MAKEWSWRGRARWTWCFIVALSGTGCSLQLKVPSDGQLTCAADAECPDGFRCQAALGLCVSQTDPDTQAPSLEGTMRVEPPIARAGVTLRARFAVSERLARAPKVGVQTSAGRLEFTIDETASSPNAGTYEYVYLTTGTEPEGAHQVTVDLIDLRGNEAPGLANAPVVFDFTPPSITLSVALAPGQTATRPGGVLSFAGSCEFGATLTEASLVDGQGNRLVGADGGEVRVSGTSAEGNIALPADLTGVAQVAAQVTVSDLAGNVSPPASSRTALVPVLYGAPTGASIGINGKPTTGTQTVVVSVTSGTAAQMRFSGDILDDASAFEWLPVADQVTLTLKPASGVKVVQATFRDGAFNEGPIIEDSIEFQPGLVVSAPVITLPAGQGAIKNGDQLVVTGSATVGSHVLSARLVNTVSGATEQNLAPSAIALSNLGALSGVVVTAGLTHGVAVALEVIVQTSEGTQSAASASRSAAATVDLQPPTSAQVSVLEGANVAQRAVTLVPSAVGATELWVEGDLDPGATVAQWIPYDTQVAVTLSAGDGAKAFVVRFRDAAHNEVLRAGVVTLDASLPRSYPTLASPWPVARVKNNDTVTIGGTVDVGTTLVSATLVSFDASNAPLSGAGCERNVTSSVTLSGIALSGTANVQTPCAGTVRVGLRVIVRNAALVTSDPSAYAAQRLTLDNSAPTPATASFEVVAPAEPGFSKLSDVTLLLAATDDGGSVKVHISGAVTATARTNQYVDFPGTEVVPGKEPVTLTSGDGLKLVNVRFADAVGNLSAIVALQITVDQSNPSTPVGPALRLSEVSASPGAPLLIASSNNTFTLTGTNGAMPGAVYADLYADAALTTLLATATVDGNGAFPVTTLPYNALHQYSVRGRDQAGNTGPVATIALPRCTLSANDPVMARAGNQLDGQPLDVHFTCDQPLAANPVVAAGGSLATWASGDRTLVGGATYRYTLAPSGSEPQGVNAAVVRVTTSPDTSRLATGSVSTDAALGSFDFTPPTLTVANLTRGEFPRGTADTVAGANAAVSDQAGAEVLSLSSYPVSVQVLAANGSTVLGTATASGSGAFSSVNLGDDLHATYTIRLTDAAGNQTNVVLTNDTAAPSIATIAVTPSVQRAGQSMTISFTVQDQPSAGPHALLANPVVTVGGRAATYQSGTLSTSDGLAHAFVYAFVPSATTDAPSGVKAINIQVSDTLQQLAVSTASAVLDFDPPTSVNTSPGARANWNGSPSVLGVASDSASSVAAVQVSVRRHADASYFDGATFDGGTESFLAATGTNPWSLSGVPWQEGGTYTIRHRAVDAAGNAETAGVGRTFVYTAALPEAPTNLTATSKQVGTIALQWAAPSGPAPQHYLVYYAPEADLAPPYAGTGADQGPSPFVVSSGTAVDVTGLPRGRYAFAVTAVSSGNQESGDSNQATAAARRWKWVLPSPRTNRPVCDAHFVDSTRVLLTTNGGAHLRSNDSGQSFQAVAGSVGCTLRTVPTIANRVVTSESSTLRYSDDNGLTFSPATVDVGGGNFYCLAVGNGTVVAFAGDTAAYHSTNGGTSYTRRSLPMYLSSPLCWSSGTAFGAFYNYGTGGVFSADGVTFSTITSPIPVHRVRTNGSTVVASGTGGVIRSTNGGQTWALVTSLPATGNPSWLWNDAEVWFVSWDGVLWRSTDDGATFQNHSASGVTAVVAGFGSLLFGLSNSNSIYRSTDRGSTFQLVSTDIGLLGQFAKSGSNLVSAYSPRLFNSQDNGATWQSHPVTWTTLSTDTAAVRGDGTRWFAYEGGNGLNKLAKLSDDGTTAIVVGNGIAGPSANTGPEAPLFIDGANVVAWSSTASQVRVSTDFGATFASRSIPDNGSITSVWGTGSRYFVVGHTGTTVPWRPYLAFTHNLSASEWTQVVFAGPGSFTQSEFLNSIYGADNGAGDFTVLTVGGNGNVFRAASLTGGFTPISSAAIPSNWYFYKVYGHQGKWVAVGQNVSGTLAGIHSSVDDGLTWTQVASSSTGGYSSVAGVGQVVLVPFGTKVLRSANGGQAFTEVATLSANVTSIDAKPGLAVAVGQVVTMSFDNGLTWVETAQASPVGFDSAYLRAVSVAPNGTAMIVGSAGDGYLFGPP